MQEKFGSRKHKQVVHALLNELIIPTIGEDDIHFDSADKIATAMPVMGYDPQNADDVRDFEERFESATLEVATL